MRYNYWTSSKLVKWIRAQIGVERPKFATRENWKKWREEYRNEHEFFYKVTEVWPNKIQNFIYKPLDLIDNFYYFLNARFKDRYYSISSSLNKNQYHEIDNRMLFCNFQALVDFVEIENAHSRIYSSNKEEYKKIKAKYGIKWYHENRWIALFLPKWRSAVAGLDALNYECNLLIDEVYCGYDKDTMPEEEKVNNKHFGQLTPQAIAARKIRDLYIWWTRTRPARPDPMDASGYTKLFNDKMNKSKNDIDAFFESAYTPEDKIASDIMWKLEEQYEKEDEEKLIELITIRRALWT